MPTRASLATLALAAAAALFQRSRPVLLSDVARADEAVRRCMASPTDVAAGDAEPHAAVDPSNPDHVVATWQSGGARGSAIQSVASFDGGATWIAPRGVPVSACAGGPIASASRGSDPWVAIAPDGRAFLGAIAWHPATAGGADPVNALVVVSSPDGGRTWTDSRVLERSAAGIQFDNVAIAADPTRPGYLYLTSTRYQTIDSATWFGPAALARSTDGGRSWEPVRTVTPNENRVRISAPQVAVDPRSGALYLGYHRSGAGAARVGVRRSDDAGQTWSEERVVAEAVPGAREENNPLTGHRAALAPDIVRLAVDPADGTVFLAYADARRDPGGRLGVSLVWSSDGRGWSSPVAVSESDRETAWLPAVAVRGAEVAVLYLRGGLTRSTTGLAPVSVRLARFRRVGATLEAIGAREIDRANFVWPGDYHALVPTRDRLLAIYARSTLGPTDRFPPSDDDPRAANPSEIFAR